MTVLKTRTLAIISVVAIFGGISLSSALGWWKTSSTKEPALIKAGEFAGLPSPTDIRGSYTWLDIEKAFGVPAAILVEAFGSAGPELKVNSLEGAYAGKLPEGIEIGTDSVRYFVSLYTGLPFDAEGSGTVLPASAIPVLRAEGKAAPALIEAAAASAFDPGKAFAATAAEPPVAAVPTTTLPAAKTAAPAATETPKAVGGTSGTTATTTGDHAPVVGAIVGKTSFFELKEWGLDMKQVEAILGGIGPSAQTVKDYCTAKGLSFSEMKTKLQELVPKAP